MIRIILADDHPVVREGLCAMLSAEPDLTVVAQASNGPQAEALCADLSPDVVLMDLSMPGGDGVDSIKRMTRANLTARIIVLTTYETERDILRAVEAGAAGYLLKDMPRGELVAAVRSAARDETVLAPTVATRLFDQLRPPRPERPRLTSDRPRCITRRSDVSVMERLTGREHDIAHLIGKGLTNKEIGARLYVSSKTVEYHLGNIYTKLSLTGRRQLRDLVNQSDQVM
ncbi:response regulator [Streptomyces sp. NPDC085932]|uniref:response regulator n=1 Tax=Streptomyces sp. NPDC085932 TaxID=3365741 RepID=UPI0037D860D3